jgi:TatD DNase family protein
VPGIIMHCFGSDAACAEACLALGCYISFAGNLTFPKAQPLRDAARVTPLDRLLVETDAPYLAPQALRGKRCEPHFVTHTAACLAEVKGVSAAEIAAQTTVNARRVYSTM